MQVQAMALAAQQWHWRRSGTGKPNVPHRRRTDADRQRRLWLVRPLW